MVDAVTMTLGGNYAEGLAKFTGDALLGVIRGGGNAASEVFQNEAKVRAPVFTGTPRPKAKYPPKPGQLRDAIYRVRTTDGRNTGTVAVYEVSWNHYKAPHGWWMEWGNSRHPAHPFIRPAFESVKGAAGQAGLQRMAVKFQELSASVAAGRSDPRLNTNVGQFLQSQGILRAAE